MNENGPQKSCPTCERPYPRTKLELVLQQKGLSLGKLAAEIQQDPKVQDILTRAKRRNGAGLTVSKNLLFRLNHQEPGFETTTELQAECQRLLLERTGMKREDLVNELPNGGYGCRTPKRSKRSAKK